MGDVITAAVRLYLQDPFSSRDDRIRAKRDLLEYINQDKEPSHRVVQAIVNNDTSRYTFADFSDDSGYWDHVDLAEDIRNQDWLRINQGQSRIDALQEYYERILSEVDNNSSYMTYIPVCEQDIRDDTVRFYSASPPTQRNYTEQIEVNNEWLDLVEENTIQNTELYEEFIQDLEDNEKVVINSSDTYNNHHKHPVHLHTDTIKFIFNRDNWKPDIHILEETDSKTGDVKYIVKTE